MKTKRHKDVRTDRNKEMRTERTEHMGTERTIMARTKKNKEMKIENTANLERKLKENAFVDTTATGFGAVEPKTESQVKVLKSAIRKYCLIRDSSFNDLKDDCILQTGSVLTENVNLVLASPPYNSRRAQGRSRPAYEVFLKSSAEDVVKLVASVITPGRADIYASRF